MELLFLLLLLILMAGALASGYPVAFALPGASIITLLAAGASGYVFTGDAGAFFAQSDAKTWISAGVANLRGLYWEPERDTLIAIPLFIFMGIMLQRSKIAEDLLITMANLFGPVRGGLGISVVFVGALLAATTGIVGATVVAMGLISLPAMLRNNYSQSLATGTIAASGTLGQIIPPSIVLIILADQLASAADQGNSIRKAFHKDSTGELTMPSGFDVTSTSAGEMFLGAFIPGLVLVGLYMVYILALAFFKPDAAPSVPYKGKYDGAFAIKVFVSLVPPLLLIFLVLGSIMAGIATVNQAGAIGAAGALIMASYRLTEGRKDSFYPAILAIVSLTVLGFVLSNFDTNIKTVDTRSDVIGVTLAILASVGVVIGLVWSGIRAFKIENTLNGVMIETAKATSLVFIILLGAAILTAAFRAFGGEHLVREFLEGLPGGFWTKFVIVMAVIFILGFFLDFIEIAVVVVPIVAPILLADPQANVTAVWLGVMIGLNIQTSFLTPPFGFALFYLRGVAPKVVKTINMYKGVVPFIALQIGAMVIVANYPSLVNYLPNRIALTSENAPPPRNPKLAHCLNQYVIQEVALNRTSMIDAAEQASAIDYTALPEDLQSSLSGSFGKVEEAINALDQAKLATQNLNGATVEFAPLHKDVRAFERDARRLVREMEDHPEIDHSDLLADQEALLAQIPGDWESKLAAFRSLQSEETKAYGVYKRIASEAYAPIKEVVGILSANSGFDALSADMEGIKDRVDNEDPIMMVEVLEELGDRVGAISGAGEIQSALSKARRALKKDEIDRDKVNAAMNDAITAYQTQTVWRQSSASLLAGLETYEMGLRNTLGVNEQDRISRDQALFVSSCQSSHRDISLNF